MSDDQDPPTAEGDARDAGHGHAHGPPIGGGTECLLCPVCVVLQALTEARPEVTQHLLAAARELALALKAGFESQAEAADRASAKVGSRLERIDVD